MSEFELIVLGNIALFWVTVGLVALIAEVVLPGGFLLSFSISAFLIAATNYIADFPESFLGRITMFVVLGVLLILPIRQILSRTLAKNRDINDY